MATLSLEDIDQDYVLADRKVVTEPSLVMVSAPMGSDTFPTTALFVAPKATFSDKIAIRAKTKSIIYQ